ncbi:MAG: methyltransferase domain-containing protein [Candidatus Heimdallarchaeota archaeon]|nr:MAG: methyltransferase domain-containing protein [Candidatus Heimdallarchaeota archaeon]
MIKANLILYHKKPIKTTDFVFFPITDYKQIPKLLSDISFKFQQWEFPSRSKQEPIIESLQKEFPNINWEEISLKFDQLGEIAILKLDPSCTSLSVRQRVGELILSRSLRLKAVLNKNDIIKGAERLYPIEYLAGEKIWQTWHQEYGVFIFVDLERAYFNPRLAEEHHRVAMSVKPGETILDLFTGVGSFALHCAKGSPCTIVAIDINPYAIDALQRSIKKNKLQGDIHSIIGDSRKILRLQDYFDRIIINLPQKSVKYLPYAAKLLKKGGIITFYQFILKFENPEEKIRKLISKNLAHINSYKELYIKVGRDVSPSRVQVNVDLQLF